MKTLYCHVGAHRTGTSFLQNTLAANRAALAREGLGYLHKHDFARTDAFTYLQNAWEKDTHRAVTFEAARDDLQAQLDAFAEPAVLLSHENLIGRAIGGGPGLYPLAERLVGEIQRLAGPHRCRIILCVRSQADFIESLYLRRVMQGKRAKRDKYLAKMAVSPLSWYGLLERLAEVVGRDDVLALPFEMVREGGRAFVDAFLGLAGVRVEGALALSDETNPSFSAAALAIHERAKPLLDEADLKQLRAFLQRALPSAKYGRPDVMDDELRMTILRREAPDNRRMLDEWVDPAFVTPRVRRAYGV